MLYKIASCAPIVDEATDHMQGFAAPHEFVGSAPFNTPSTTYSASARLDVRPGLSIPSKLIIGFTFSCSPG